VRFYLATLYSSNFHKGGALYNFLSDAERAGRDSVGHFLESYHYIGKGKYADRIRTDGIKIFLDSGAYSSMTKGVHVDIAQYARYIRANADILVTDHDSRGNTIISASVLDAIGDPDQTWRNQKQLEDWGLTVLPCYHYGEPVEVLQYYIEHYEYITIGGMVPVSNSQLETWLDRIWGNYLTDARGGPRVKVHGFGLTSLYLVERYPWFSIDSSTWVQASFNGGIMLPHFGVLTVAANMGHRSLNIKDQGRHFDTLTAPEQDAVRAFLSSNGYDIDRMRMHYQSRWAYNCWAYKQRLDGLHEVAPSFVQLQPELF
jgi:hypothetical protein